ncbi:Benzaldehyde dehydrogenase (NAD(+)) [Capsicum baccatum]|uniref:Benzaldehyde dehydrogenase (NAD(+)) n=1 Tax=Capsicum baccatum TaxID=33114 RepID=A0A2G2VPJ9_CAPBA|nr:Benzaldehyde dehydrogenase (NAD(+)) [Capsicum baccatum]
MKVNKFPLPIPRDFNASNAKGGGTRLVSANWRNIILREGKLYYLREEVVIESAKVDGKPQDGEQEEVLEWVEVPHWLGNGMIVCLYVLGQSSSHELAFGVELGTGEAVYVDDIPSPPNCLHGAFIYSTKPLAGVKGIQLESNRLSDGVTAIITFTDIPSGGANVGAITTFGPSP